MSNPRHVILKFKVGDLVRTLFPLDIDYYSTVVPSGSIGLITDTSGDSVGGYDYMVSVMGLDIVFFENELEIFNIEGVNEDAAN